MTYVSEWVEGSGRAKDPILWRCECGARMAYFLLRCQKCRRTRSPK
jgi:hypothetical protein